MAPEALLEKADETFLVFVGRILLRHLQLPVDHLENGRVVA